MDTDVKLALSMYLGEQCKYCGRTYEALDDLRDTVFAGAHELACHACWRANNPAPDNNEIKLTRTGLAGSEVEFPDAPGTAPELG